MESLSGKISGIVYSDRNTGFYILKVTSDSLDGANVKVVGTFPGVNLAVGLKATFRDVKWVEHPEHGQQVSAGRCDVVPDKGKTGIVTYLISCVPSIGPVTAGKLYAAFGDELVTILDQTPEKILEVEFLTKIQSKAILDEWKNASEARSASVFLVDLGLNAAQVKSAYSKFGASSIAVVKEDPYRLYECPGIGFQTADVAARKTGVGVDDQRRVMAMISFALTEMASNEGHMFSVSDQVMNYITRLFRRHSVEPFSHGEYVSGSMYYPALAALRVRGDITCDGDHIYLSRHWIHESDSAACIAEILSQPPRSVDDLVAVLLNFEKTSKLALSDDQRNAISLLKSSRLCAVTGFPGTGKTLLISAFVSLFESLNWEYSLLSPTGIAAKRLSQVTGRSASTIHRALGYKRDGTWEFNRSNKYIVDAVIVDETSMVDSATFYHLVSALPKTTVLILVGDSAQLPSVGAGYVLQNLLRCSDVPSTALTKIYRQEDRSAIVSVAHSILRGESIDTSFRERSEFVFLPYSDDQVIDEIRRLTTRMKDRGSNFQVMAPVYDGLLGVNSLNQKLREVLNPEFVSGRASKIKHGASDMYEGDRVMVVKNDYDRMIFNGDVGKVQRISIKDDNIEVRIFDWFDHESPTPRYVDKIFSYTLDEARHVLRVAYACTVHKCQGQEFDYAILPMTTQYGIMLYRNLLYTAITRAKKKVFLFGDPRAFAQAVANNRETIRNSALSELISNGLHPKSVTTNQAQTLPVDLAVSDSL